MIKHVPAPVDEAHCHGGSDFHVSIVEYTGQGSDDFGMFKLSQGKDGLF